ncbi:sigma-54-dependent transcriptional regulator [Sphingomonas sp. Mn802worker]|uniref:sigma-54-dependent transcriptional regulator n=1 Tax=Sphingomonas sp. Mn802worker TaxID=629773 RepID=UPI000379C544|nr:sigma-54 dependent transcriptional regulator [Sphingomonas sp. Mn802worker]
MSERVLLIEDDHALRLATEQALDLAGFAVDAFARAEPALGAIGGDFSGIVVSDIRMPGMDGFQLLARLRMLDPDLPVILVTGHGDVPMAVSALRDGAFDFVTKPFATEQLVAAIRRGLDRRALVMENRRLRDAAQGSDDPLIGNTPAMLHLRRSVRELADLSVDVLIEGETGTGKDLVARLLHRLGRRGTRPFVVVDCAALDGEAGELELFGDARRSGQIVASNNGTLLLDAVDCLPAAIQARLLRVVEEREVQPRGANWSDPVNLRLVATSAPGLEQAVADGRFRADLFHRLAQARLVVPPLRARDTDATLLFTHFIEEAKQSLGREDYLITPEARHRLLTHDWPGNVRELRNYAFASVLASGSDAADAGGLRDRVARFEASVIVDTLTATGGHVANALAILGIPRKTLYEKMARHGIDPAAYRSL